MSVVQERNHQKPLFERARSWVATSWIANPFKRRGSAKITDGNNRTKQKKTRSKCLNCSRSATVDEDRTPYRIRTAADCERNTESQQLIEQQPAENRTVTAGNESRHLTDNQGRQQTVAEVEMPKRKSHGVATDSELHSPQKVPKRRHEDGSNVTDSEILSNEIKKLPPRVEEMHIDDTLPVALNQSSPTKGGSKEARSRQTKRQHSKEQPITAKGQLNFVAESERPSTAKKDDIDIVGGNKMATRSASEVKVPDSSQSPSFNRHQRPPVQEVVSLKVMSDRSSRHPISPKPATTVAVHTVQENAMQVVQKCPPQVEDIADIIGSTSKLEVPVLHKSPSVTRRQNRSQVLELNVVGKNVDQEVQLVQKSACIIGDEAPDSTSPVNSITPATGSLPCSDVTIVDLDKVVVPPEGDSITTSSYVNYDDVAVVGESMKSRVSDEKLAVFVSKKDIALIVHNDNVEYYREQVSSHGAEEPQLHSPKGLTPVEETITDSDALELLQGVRQQSVKATCHGRDPPAMLEPSTSKEGHEPEQDIKKLCYDRSACDSESDDFKSANSDQLSDSSETFSTGDESQNPVTPPIPVKPSDNQKRKNRTEPVSPKKMRISKQLVSRSPVGLSNLGNTCYFNSVMQNVNQTILLSVLLKTQKTQTSLLGSYWSSSRQPITQSLVDFYQKLSTRSSNFSPHDLFTAVSIRSSRFQGGRQQDSHELLRHMMDGVKEEEKDVNKDLLSGDGQYRHLTVVDEVFGGHYLTVFNCEKCHMPYHLFEPFLDVSLPIAFIDEEFDYKKNLPQSSCQQDSSQTNSKKGKKKNKNKKQRQNNSVGTRSQHRALDIDDGDEDQLLNSTPELDKLQDQASGNNMELENAQTPDDAYKAAIKIIQTRMSVEKNPFERDSVLDSLRFYTRKEKLVDEYLCLKCNEGLEDYILTTGTKQTIIYNPPAILTVHLKRFEQTAHGYKKVNRHINFSTELDLSPYCSQLARRRQELPEIKYKLYGIVVHGGSLHGGHYTACVKVRSVDVEQTKKFLQTKFMDRDVLMAKDELVKLVQNKMKLSDPEDQYLDVADVCCSDATEQWYDISDSWVSTTTESSVLGMQAYLLFYERVF